MINVPCSRTLHSDAGEARTRGRSVSNLMPCLESNALPTEPLRYKTITKQTKIVIVTTIKSYDQRASETRTILQRFVR